MRPDKAKVAVDWNTGSSFLAGSEVRCRVHIHRLNIDCYVEFIYMYTVLHDVIV